MKLCLPLLIACLFYLSSFAQKRELIWEDNFNTGQLDTEYWNIETGTGVNGDFGTGQIDRATDREENISFTDTVPGAEDGCLVITTREEYYIDRNYTSARVNTGGKEAWGPGHRIVARVYPRDVKQMGQGFAFWMMPDELPPGWDYIMWPQGGEIDIMEYVGSIPYHNLGSVHYAWEWNNNQWAEWNHGHKGAYYSFETGQVPNPAEPGYGNYPAPENDPNAGSSGFHEYGIDRYQDRIEFFIDDNVYHIHYLDDGGGFAKDGEDQFAIRNIDGRRVGVSEYSNHFSEWYPFTHKMYLLLTAGVGGKDYSYGGAVSHEAEFPCLVFIDWVRVYKLDPHVGISETKKNIDFNIHPNTMPGKLEITFSGNDYGAKTLNVIDMQGIVQKELTVKNEKTVSIDLDKLAVGIYILSVVGPDGLISKKFIVTNAK